MSGGTIELSMSEAVIVQMGLRTIMDGNVKPIDKRIAEEIDRKIRIAYKGRKIRMMLFEDDGQIGDGTNLKR